MKESCRCEMKPIFILKFSQFEAAHNHLSPHFALRLVFWNSHSTAVKHLSLIVALIDFHSHQFPKFDIKHCCQHHALTHTNFQCKLAHSYWHTCTHTYRLIVLGCVLCPRLQIEPQSSINPDCWDNYYAHIHTHTQIFCHFSVFSTCLEETTNFPLNISIYPEVLAPWQLRSFFVLIAPWITRSQLIGH